MSTALDYLEKVRKLADERKAREAREAAEAVEIARGWLARGASVVVRGQRGAFGGIVQWHELVWQGESLGSELYRRFGNRDALTSAPVKALLTEHAEQELIDTETEQCKSYLRAVSK